MKCSTNYRIRLSNCRGQALVEFTFVAITLLMMLFGLIDFCRAIYTRQVMTSLTREGSNLASRNTSITSAAQAVVDSANPLDIDNHGEVIVTAVFNKNNTFIITNQFARGALTTPSRIGTGIGSTVVSNWMPNTIETLPQSNKIVYVTEVYYQFQPATPIGALIGIDLSRNLYDVAYF